jgi:hypothetical protein
MSQIKITQDKLTKFLSPQYQIKVQSRKRTCENTCDVKIYQKADKRYNFIQATVLLQAIKIEMKDV